MNILVLCKNVPYVFRKTDDFRLHLILEELKKNHTVKVLCLSKTDIKEYSEKYNTDVVWMKNSINKESAMKSFLFKGKSFFLSNFYSSSVRNEIVGAVRDFKPDLIVYNNVGFYDFIGRFSNVKRIFSVDNCLYMYYARLSSVYDFIRRKMLLTESKRIMVKEKAAFVYSDAIWFGAFSDMNNVNSQLQLITPGYYLPGYTEEFEYPALKNNHHVLIYGDFRTRVGRLMYKYYIANIHGSMKKKYSDYKVYVAGNLIPNMYSDDNVEFAEELTKEILDDVRIYFSCYKFRTNLFYPEITCAGHGIPICGCDKGIGFVNVKDKKEYCATVFRRRDLKNYFLEVIDNDNVLEKCRKNSYNYVKENFDKEKFEKTIQISLEKI